MVEFERHERSRLERANLLSVQCQIEFIIMMAIVTHIKQVINNIMTIFKSNTYDYTLQCYSIGTNTETTIIILSFLFETLNTTNDGFTVLPIAKITGIIIVIVLFLIEKMDETTIMHPNKAYDASVQDSYPRKTNYFSNNYDKYLVDVAYIILVSNWVFHQNIYHFVVYLNNMHGSLIQGSQFDPYQACNMMVDYLGSIDSIIHKLYDYTFQVDDIEYHDDIYISIQLMHLIDVHLDHIYIQLEQITLIIEFHLLWTLLMENDCLYLLLLLIYLFKMGIIDMIFYYYEYT